MRKVNATRLTLSLPTWRSHETQKLFILKLRGIETTYTSLRLIMRLKASENGPKVRQCTCWGNDDNLMFLLKVPTVVKIRQDHVINRSWYSLNPEADYLQNSHRSFQLLKIVWKSYYWFSDSWWGISYYEPYSFDTSILLKNPLFHSCCRSLTMLPAEHNEDSLESQARRLRYLMNSYNMIFVLPRNYRYSTGRLLLCR